MKNKILFALVILFASAMLFGCASSTDTKKENTDNKPIETTTDKNDAEPTTDAPSEDGELGTDNVPETEPIVEDETDDIESEREFFAFEGKYWVCDDDYKSVGYYFDGLDLTMIVEGESKTVRPYDANGSKINFIDGEAFDECYWEVQGEYLTLDYDESRTLKQVKESEFQAMFNWVSDTYNP